MSPDQSPMEFDRIAESVRAAPTPVVTGEEIVRYVRRQLYADRASISLIRGGRLETVASTDWLVVWADVLQYELNEGPCRDSSWHRETLLASDLTADGRWPRWAAKVTTLGLASVLAAELTSDRGQRVGAINVYWTHRRAFSADDIAFVNILARHAAISLAESLNEAGLHMALDSPNPIGQAEGILVGCYGLDKVRAFEVLRRYSQHHNIKLRKAAEHLISASKQPPSAEIASA